MLTLVGAVNLPIIKFSVDWWNTLHQPASVLRMGGNAIDPSFLLPLLVMAVAFSLLFVTLHLAAMRNEILRRRVRSMQMMQAKPQASVSAMSSRSPCRLHRRRLCGDGFRGGRLVAWVVLDYSAQRRILRELEERGVTRRSQRKDGR